MSDSSALSDHFRCISERGDPLEEMAEVVDHEAFRPVLEDALQYSDGSRGGRPPYDPVAMFKIPILAAQHGSATPGRSAWSATVQVGSGFQGSNQASRRRTRTRSCLLYTSPSPRDGLLSRMPSSA